MADNETLVFINLYDQSAKEDYYLPLRLTKNEIDLLRGELSEYDKWKDSLTSGMAPDFSYENPKLSEDLYLASRKKYYSKFIGVPSQKLIRNIFPVSFGLITPSTVMDTGYANVLESYKNKELPLMSKKYLINFILRPLGENQVGLGYKLLPFIKELLT